MKLILAIFVVAFAESSFAAQPSHCQAAEAVFFTCVTQNSRILSVCASWPDEALPPKYVYYRFGKKGAPEFSFPEVGEPPTAHFRYSSEAGPKWRNTYLQFSNQGFTYTLFGYGNSNIPEGEASVTVVSPTGKRRVFECRNPGYYAGSDLWPMELLKLPAVKDAFK